jgi:periplasmic protein TonB
MRSGVVLAIAIAVGSCARSGAAGSDDSPPVALGDPVVEYPPALFLQGVSGIVELRLFVDSAGQVVPESSSVRKSSGYPALDSAALAAAPRLRYAPGTRRGRPVPMLFLQPIHFRHPGSPDSTP